MPGGCFARRSGLCILPTAAHAFAPLHPPPAARGNAATVTDSSSGIKATYGYDHIGRLAVYREEAGDNSVYGRAAYERSYYDPKGANDLWNTRPFQDTKPSQEMQIFTKFMYDHDFVADISVSASISKTKINVKVGASKVLSPNKNINASYVHAGAGASTPSVLPINISYSVGIVNGVKSKENYAKHFLDIGAGAIFGFDYCFWPNGASAYSFTIGTSYGVYGGYDYYWCLD